MTGAQAVEQFRAAMACAGLEFRGDLRADGALHRVHVEGDKAGSKNGWYVLHADGVPAGEFGCWKRGIQETWHADIGRSLTHQEEQEQRARLAAMKQQRERDQAARHAEGRREAAKVWKAASKARADHPYLKAKGVKPHGLRQLREQLVIPVRDTAGELHGLQFIQADGSKLFKGGTNKVGHYHAVGPKVTDLVAICEGYATAASVHESTGWPVAVAFDMGNLRPVAAALQARFPSARIVICGDNDVAKPGNPGATAAQEAATAGGALVALPVFDEGEPGKDWNDYAQLCGAERTREALQAALQTQPAAAPQAKAKPGKALNSSAVRAHFSQDERGIWWHGIDQRGDALNPYWIGPPLNVAAELRGVDNKDWGLLLEFNDPDGCPHRWGMPLSMLAGSCEAMRHELLRLGYKVSTRNNSRNLLADFIQQAAPEARARSVERTGWYERAFVLPERTIGEVSEAVLFQSESTERHVYRERGELGEWRADVADLCRGNSRLLFAVSAAFAAMLVHWAGEESGGFHLRGGSSSGKTTALRVAASVYGDGRYLHRWRATDNALEGLAAGHSDTLLILDELAQIDPRIAGEAAYLLSNGQGKHRQQRTGAARTVLSWRLLFLSAGEIGLADHMHQAGKRAHVGQETRLADIPADAGLGKGIFENLHGHKDGAAFSRALSESVKHYHGTAAVAFIRAVQERLDDLPDQLKAQRTGFAKRHVPPGADGQVLRVAGRFALVASAGELATAAGITGWSAGEAAEGALACFRAWLGQRGSSGNLEPQRALQQVRLFLEQHGKSRFERWSADQESGNYVIQNRAGFRRGELAASGDHEELFYVLPEVFREEVCKGLDPRAVARALAEAGCLKIESGRQFTNSVRLPGMGKVRAYIVTPSIFANSSGEPEGDSHEVGN